MRIIYCAPIGTSNAVNGGYGNVAVKMKRMFEFYKKENDIEIEYIDTYTFNGIKNLSGTYDICIVLSHPNSFKDKKVSDNFQTIFSFCKKKYLHIFWETTKLPSSWKWLWQNFVFDGFIASSSFNYSLIENEIKRHGTDKSVHLIYVPVFSEIFKNKKINVEEKKEEEKTFNVLYIGQLTKRKGLEDAIIGFAQALGDKEDCNLYIKYHRLSNLEPDVESIINYNFKSNCKESKAKVFVMSEDLKEDKIYDLYNRSSLLLFTSRGEGFGFPSIEAGMIGLPINYVDGSSLPEVSNFFGNYKIDCYQDTAYNMTQYEYDGDSEYWVPYIKSIKESLLNQYNIWKESKEDYYIRCQNNDKYIDNKFGYVSCIEQFEDLLNYTNK